MDSTKALHLVRQWELHGDDTCTLCLANLGLVTLPVLPHNLKRLRCSHNLLTVLGVLPPGLVELWCDNNRLTTLGDLPAGLQELYCSFNFIVSVDRLPASLRTLWCCFNPIVHLDNLPAGLTDLSCVGIDALTVGGSLPVGLVVMYCGDYMKVLKALPTGLTHFSCGPKTLLPDVWPRTLKTAKLYGPLPDWQQAWMLRSRQRHIAARAQVLNRLPAHRMTFRTATILLFI
jgi:hypothetical protein